MIRKELHLDEKVISTLKEEAKRQNRSLENYLEYLVTEQSKRLELPSKEYRDMMTDLLEKFDSGQINFSNIEDIIK